MAHELMADIRLGGVQGHGVVANVLRGKEAAKSLYMYNIIGEVISNIIGILTMLQDNILTKPFKKSLDDNRPATGLRRKPVLLIKKSEISCA